MRGAIRARHYSRRTEEAYVHWIRQFIVFHGKQHPETLGADAVARFLTWLAVERRVSASTQNQALSGLLFLYRHVLQQPVDELPMVVRARTPERLPVVLSRSEVTRVLAELSGPMRLVGILLYGAGLRLQECLELRVKDLDFDLAQVTVRQGKGQKDRRTPLPMSVVEPLRAHLVQVQQVHAQDLAAGHGRVQMPFALERKYPGAAASWGWQFVFPASRVCKDPRYGPPSRFHVHESVAQRAVAEAVRRAGLVKRVSCHTFRHSFATHLLEDGYDIRTVQELRSRATSTPTCPPKRSRRRMIYTHVLARGALGVRSPADRL